MEAVVQHGVDRIVEGPVGVLERAMGMSRTAALDNLKWLELDGFITRYQDPQTMAICRVRILTDALPERLHEHSEEQRLLGALWKYRRPSQEHPGSFMVHATFFPDVRVEADLEESNFYRHLSRLSVSGLIQPVLLRKARYLYIILTSKFPEM